jgi:hypothetical protein
MDLQSKEFNMIVPSYASKSDKHIIVYRAFYNMHTRCYNALSDDYANYGGRGIKVEGIWNLTGKIGYEAFLKDMGLPSTFDLSLDRIDVNKNYSKDNCRWATPVEQALNKRERQHTISYVISFDMKTKRYKVYRKNLDLKTKTYIGVFKTLEDAQTKIKELI